MSIEKDMEEAFNFGPEINRNREPIGQGEVRETRLEDQVQRLQTYNTLLRDTLMELYDLNAAAEVLGRKATESPDYIHIMNKAKKVLA